MAALQYLHFNSITISFEKGDDLSIPLLYFYFATEPIFLITNNAEKLRIRLEELFNANTVYIQRIKDRPLEARKDVDERDLEKLINVLFYLVM